MLYLITYADNVWTVCCSQVDDAVCLCVRDIRDISVWEPYVSYVTHSVCVCVWVCCCWVKSSIVRSLPPCLQVTMGTGGVCVCMCIAIMICELVAFRGTLQQDKQRSQPVRFGSALSLFFFCFFSFLVQSLPPLFSVQPLSPVDRQWVSVMTESWELMNETPGTTDRQASGIQIRSLTVCVCVCECVSVWSVIYTYCVCVLAFSRLFVLVCEVCVWMLAFFNCCLFTCSFCLIHVCTSVCVCVCVHSSFLCLWMISALWMMWFLVCVCVCVFHCCICCPPHWFVICDCVQVLSNDVKCCQYHRLFLVCEL